MHMVDESIELDVPVHVAYQQWTQFEKFPEFMESVKEVKRLDETHLHWVIEIGGRELAWDAEITEQQTDELIAWKSTSGELNAGVVTFHPLDSDRCRLDVEMNYVAEGLIEGMGSALRWDTRSVKANLDRFKERIERQSGKDGSSPVGNEKPIRKRGSARPRHVKSETPLADLTVADAMHVGVYTCQRSLPLRDAARMMVMRGIHCLVVTEPDDDRAPSNGLWGVLTAVDLLSALGAATLDNATAGDCAASPTGVVSPQTPLQNAARLMHHHGVDHLVVVESDSMRPTGVLSSLDVAAAIASLSQSESGPAQPTAAKGAAA
jgi:CBS domain-containing protein